MERTSPLRSSHRDGQKTYMERLIQSPDEGVMPRKDASLLEVLTQVGISDGRKFRQVSGLWGKPEETYLGV